ncbi:PaaI family thioesterase [Tsukamurella sp. PLM1]|uniref:PaaI family thioesterase n=1 Tax=Tsukamurella sp. PLM1 TaxID=2929795 RepID=UPI00205DB665|nr:PaaI family thioesterase [Tsukamurella sp. PLM1]BDH58854.1 putative phenylacetic acid degradation protein [Tsukamurella sp. PLM1]
MTATDDDPLAPAVAVLDAQPFNALVGARVTAFRNGTAELVLDVEERHRQQYGVVHGGVMAYLADNVLTFAAGSAVGPDVITGGVSVDYLRAVRTGRLRAVASVAHRSRRHAVVTGEIWHEPGDGEPRLCAIAHGTVFVTAPKATS